VALAVLAALGFVVGIRAVWTFLRETVRVDPGDGRWWLRWPAATMTGRFGRHKGHFDPGQRIANVLFVVTLGAAVGSGIALTQLKGGDTFVWTLRVHRWSTYALTPLVIGHVLIALGILPGYRGVWRSMHFGGRVREDTARRVWPESVEEN
jgi:formate dehydrogenase subunit gamma